MYQKSLTKATTSSEHKGTVSLLQNSASTVKEVSHTEQVLKNTKQEAAISELEAPNKEQKLVSAKQQRSASNEQEASGLKEESKTDQEGAACIKLEAPVNQDLQGKLCSRIYLEINICIQFLGRKV